MIDGRADHLYLPRAQIALQVRRVVVRVPKTKLDEREQLQGARRIRLVAQGDLMHLGVESAGHQVQEFGFQALAGAGDARVAEPMAALEGVQLRLYWRVAGRPEFAVL